MFDLPERPLVVIEHQVVSRRCGCGAVSPGSAPAFAAAPVQYGPRVRAAAVYLMHEQFLSVNRTADAMADLFGVELAVATPTGAVAACAKTVAPVGVVIADRIAGAGLAHFDETGFRVASACHLRVPRSPSMLVTGLLSRPSTGDDQTLCACALSSFSPLVYSR